MGFTWTRRLQNGILILSPFRDGLEIYYAKDLPLQMAGSYASL